MAGKTIQVEKLTEAGQRRRERMRRLLIEAAMRLFARQGVDATTIDEIVDVAGVAKGTFYNYFPDRAEIARAVASSVRHEMNAAVAEINEGIEDPAERVSRGVKLYLAFAIRNPVRARILARIYEGGAEALKDANQHLLEDLADGIARGVLRVPSIEAALHLVLGVATTGMRHLLDTGATRDVLTGGGYAQELATVLLQGLGVRPAHISRILARPFDVDHLAVWK